MSGDELNPSELGTKEYWASAYSKELVNFKEFGDEGEVWFGEQNERRVVKWIAKNFAPSDSVVDIGCGNGHLLARLATEHDFRCLTGLDYVDEALELARNLVTAEKVEDRVSFEVCDLLSSPAAILDAVKRTAFAVVVDKGTYDAICLMPDMNQARREAYITSVKTLLRGSLDNGDGKHLGKARFAITSCNWTRDELVNHFANDFDLVEELPTPTMSFGGKQGRTVTSLIFRIKQTS